MKKNPLKNGAKAGAYSAVLTVIVIAAAIIINLIVSALPSKYTKIDTSQDSVFSFSERTEKYVEGIKDDITVYHICEDGMEDKYLTEILDRYGETATISAFISNRYAKSGCVQANALPETTFART